MRRGREERKTKNKKENLSRMRYDMEKCDDDIYTIRP